MISYLLINSTRGVPPSVANTLLAQLNYVSRPRTELPLNGCEQVGTLKVWWGLPAAHLTIVQVTGCQSSGRNCLVGQCQTCGLLARHLMLGICTVIEATHTCGHPLL